jgi:DNA invertase Pin-like site-specific DNA recombinase
MTRGSLERALRALEGPRRSAGGLVVAKLDRLSRLLDFSSLMERAQKRGWAIVALDLGVDTASIWLHSHRDRDDPDR